MASRSDHDWRSGIARGFRAAALGQAIVVLGRAALAGLALLISLFQGVLGILLKSLLPRWAVRVSLGLFLGEAIQMASRRLHLFVVHFPLGVALFAGLVPLAVWIAAGHGPVGR
jgi:hypothetical protein